MLISFNKFQVIMIAAKNVKPCFIGMLIGFSVAFIFLLGIGVFQREAINFDCSQDLTHYDPSAAWEKGFDETLINRAIEAFHARNFTRPPNEECKKRFPACIIIGIRKCGTRELLQFLHLHPHIEIYHQKSYEMPFFVDDENFAKGENWFRNEMPCSYSNQITLMKNSVYFSFPSSAERIHKFNSSIKMLLMVREPVARAISQYMFGLQRKQINAGAAMEQVIFENNELNEAHKIVKDSTYDTAMLEYLKYFRLDQFLVIDTDELRYNPAAVLHRVEDFLGLAHYITPDMFVWNKEKGYYCIKTHLSDTGMACYPPGRGKQIVDINPQTRAILTDFFRPRSQRFFDIIGRSFNWD